MIDWSDEKYSTGIDEIDKQHKKLIGIVNELHKSYLNNKAQDTINDVFKELLDYTDYHFNTEEELMKKYNYFDLYNHQKSHEKFKEKIKNYQKRYYQSILDGEDNESMFSNIIVFLVNWISVHIREVDKQYVPYIKGE